MRGPCSPTKCKAWGDGPHFLAALEFMKLVSHMRTNKKAYFVNDAVVKFHEFKSG